jgi:hypothetical protein
MPLFINVVVRSTLYEHILYTPNRLGYASDERCNSLAKINLEHSRQFPTYSTSLRQFLHEHNLMYLSHTTCSFSTELDILLHVLNRCKDPIHLTSPPDPVPQAHQPADPFASHQPRLANLQTWSSRLCRLHRRPREFHP